MAMKEMPKGLPFLLMFTESVGREPSMYGYSDARDRDEMFEVYAQTGRIFLKDELLNVEQSFEPVYVGRVDLLDGLVNANKVKAELDGLAK